MYGPNVSDHTRWEVKKSSSPNPPTWQASLYIDDMNYGTALANTKGAAQDEAARIAYNNLRREGFS
ncbi:hypothetical protein K503DRAFT_805012 [Rhizopogon vinicolor AM-OR11-026]|uniref:DRBM domain-containing protein n=1 Tax=Rhizopogon vinicolor AM-OR11-026 TaxID=1314800 RepID=A0A1B7MJC5_9AGAM|nr:hypothetical protein K503DRAFT_805012 [Rhizopogon vinicolor AM-OR11-026]